MENWILTQLLFFFLTSFAWDMTFTSIIPDHMLGNVLLASLLLTVTIQ